MKLLTFLSYPVPLWGTILAIVLIIIFVVVLKNKQIRYLQLRLRNAGLPAKLECSKKKILEEQENQREKVRQSIEFTLRHWRSWGVSWKTMYDASNYYEEGIKVFNPVLKAFDVTPLANVLTVTPKKTQITWDDTNLNYMLKLVEAMAQRNYDKDLDKLIKKFTDEFLNVIIPINNYRGYDSLMKAVIETCPTMVDLIKQNKPEAWPA